MRSQDAAPLTNQETPKSPPSGLDSLPYMEVGWDVSTDNRDEDFLDAALVGPRAAGSPYRAAGFAGSAILHGVVLFLLLAMAEHGMQTARGGLLYVPVEIATPSPELRAGQKTTVPPPQDIAHDPAANSQQGAAGQSETAELDAKLQTLAKLRQPDDATELGTSTSRTAAINDDAMPGQQALYNVRDLIRAQVERRWNFDLAALGDNHFSVPIRVEITSDGVVTKAEIVDNARSADPVYHEVAVSARNAVLLASPFALPPGHYQGVLDLVLNLDPRDALR